MKCIITVIICIVINNSSNNGTVIRAREHLSRREVCARRTQSLYTQMNAPHTLFHHSASGGGENGTKITNGSNM